MKNFVTLLGFLIFLGVSPANAAIEGDSVNASYYFPTSSALYADDGNAIVGSGVEFLSSTATVYPFDYFDIDLSNSGITVTYTKNSGWTGSVAFNGFELTNLTKSFDTLTFVSSTNPFFGAGNFSSSGNKADFNWQGLTFVPGDVINISAVPEPETHAMLLVGLGLMGFVVRHRKNEQS